MRMLMSVTFPVDQFNAFVKDGSVGAKLGEIMAALKPDAAYFTEMHGQRGCIMIVQLDDPAQVPAFAEPFFLLFNAKVEFHIVMSPEDLQRAGLEAAGEQWAA